MKVFLIYISTCLANGVSGNTTDVLSATGHIPLNKTKPRTCEQYVKEYTCTDDRTSLSCSGHTGCA